MTTFSATEARAKLYRLIDQAAESHEPIRIVGNRRDAVLVSATDWAAMQETLCLLSVPGLRDSIIDGINTPIDRCANHPGW